MIEARRRCRIFIVLFLSVTLLGTLGFMILEKLPFFDALYYNIVTMSTVGYGDIHPTLPSTRLLAILIIVLGGGTFIGLVANATEMMLLQRDVAQRMKKQNIILGIFFSEMGYHLLKLFSACDRDRQSVSDLVEIDMDWSGKKLAALAKRLDPSLLKVDIPRVNLNGLTQFLSDKHGFILSLLENPVLVEHIGFTELLLAVSHLSEELRSRASLDALPQTDLNHLAGDMNRGYALLVAEWLAYLIHLKLHYPYLYSLAVRKNPFNPNATPVIDKA